MQLALNTLFLFLDYADNCETICCENGDTASNVHNIGTALNTAAKSSCLKAVIVKDLCYICEVSCGLNCFCKLHCKCCKCVNASPACAFDCKSVAVVKHFLTCCDCDFSEIWG